VLNFFNLQFFAGDPSPLNLNTDSWVHAGWNGYAYICLKTEFEGLYHMRFSELSLKMQHWYIKCAYCRIKCITGFLFVHLVFRAKHVFRILSVWTAAAVVLVLLVV
jgi:hypothetical protein